MSIHQCMPALDSNTQYETAVLVLVSSQWIWILYGRLPFETPTQQPTFECTRFDNDTIIHKWHELKCIYSRFTESVIKGSHPFNRLLRLVLNILPTTGEHWWHYSVHHCALSGSDLGSGLQTASLKAATFKHHAAMLVSHTNYVLEYSGSDSAAGLQTAPPKAARLWTSYRYVNQCILAFFGGMFWLWLGFWQFNELDFRSSHSFVRIWIDYFNVGFQLLK